MVHGRVMLRIRLQDGHPQVRGDQGCQEAQLVLIDDKPGHAAQAADFAEFRAPDVEVLQCGSGQVQRSEGAVLQLHPCCGGGPQVQFVDDAAADQHVSKLGPAEVEEVHLAAVDPDGLPAALIEFSGAQAGIAELNLAPGAAGTAEHGCIQLPQDAVAERGTPKLCLVEGSTLKKAFGKDRSAKLQPIPVDTAEPNVVMPAGMLDSD